MNKNELRMQRRQIVQFIKAQKTTISLKRPQLAQTAAGGQTPGPPVDIDPQDFRLVPFKRRLVVGTVDTQEGEVPFLKYVLIGRYDADVEIGDWFTLDDVTYTVKSLERNRTIRTAAELDSRA